MFKKQISILLCILIFGIFSFFVIFRYSNEADTIAYQNLIAQSSSARNSKGMYKAQQQRYHVTKHFLLMKDADRLQMRLSSPRSDLLFEQEDDKTEIVENFQNVKCLIQESLSYMTTDGKEARLQENGQFLITDSDSSLPASWLKFNDPRLVSKQIIRKLDAAAATYHYRTEELFADEVKLSRFSAAGKQLTEPMKSISLLMSGTAKSIQLSLTNGETPFKAQDLKATFNEWGKRP